MAGGTVYALSSGRGAAGVALVRVSGPRALAALAALTPGSPQPPARAARVRRLIDPSSGQAIDQALVLVFPAPASFTGEDVVELHVHGGQAVVAALLAALERLPGLAPADPGAFTRRAFDNGKLDLAEVEGLADLIAAETEGQRRQALRQLEGGLGALTEGWRQRLLMLQAHVEAEIEFGEDEADVGEGLGVAALAALAGLRAEFAGHLAEGQRGERLRQGLTVVVLGAPNVGKSSLINALAERDLAIVTSVAGTTRDIIEAHLDVEGLPVCLVDTAGLRDSDDPVEQEGIARARARAARADLILAVSDGAAPWPETGDGPVLRLRTKADLGGADPAGTQLALSTATGDGVAVLRRWLAQWAAQEIGSLEAPRMTRARHRAALAEAADHLDRAARQPDLVLAAEDLRLGVRALGRITGRVDVEDMLDQLFASFCIGK